MPSGSSAGEIRPLVKRGEGVLVGRNPTLPESYSRASFEDFLVASRKKKHTHPFFRKRIFRLRELRNVENHRNLGVEKFHRYQAFSLRKQKGRTKESKVLEIFPYTYLSNYQQNLTMPDTKDTKVDPVSTSHNEEDDWTKDLDYKVQQ